MTRRGVPGAEVSPVCGGHKGWGAIQEAQGGHWTHGSLAWILHQGCGALREDKKELLPTVKFVGGSALWPPPVHNLQPGSRNSGSMH